MSTELLRYFEQRFYQERHMHKSASLPFVTLSRETGCNSIAIAKKLIFKLNTTTSHRWKLVSKEELGSAAEKLHLDPRKLDAVFSDGKRSQMDEILQAFSEKYYKSDKTIRKTIREIIRDIASDGYAVVVGRAGVAITHDMPAGLHCRLHAPFDWRVKNIATQMNMDEKSSLEYVRDTDEKRAKLIYDFSGKLFTAINFDISLNNFTLNDDTIADLLFDLMRIKNMV
jgi:cytidylate kinase